MLMRRFQFKLEWFVSQRSRRNLKRVSQKLKVKSIRGITGLCSRIIRMLNRGLCSFNRKRNQKDDFL